MISVVVVAEAPAAESGGSALLAERHDEVALRGGDGLGHDRVSLQTVYGKRKRTARGGPLWFFVSISIISIPHNSHAWMAKFCEEWNE
jgi:hypothetical protein